MISTIFGQLFDRVVIGEYIAVDASQQWDIDFQDRNKEMIRRFADWPIAH
jgi:hypothetical protein